MNQSDNQSIVINGVSTGVSAAAHDDTLDDLTVQNTDAIKGGPINEFLVSDKYVAASARALGGLTSK